MATRFYVTPGDTVSGYATSSDLAIWDDPGQFADVAMFPYRTNQGITEFSASDSSGTTTNWAIGHERFVSPPLAAQTIDGTLKAYFQASESSNSANFVSQLSARVMSGSGGTQRGVLYAGDSSGTHSSEWSTTQSSRSFPRLALAPITLSSVSAQRGDRIIVEVGQEVHNTGGTQFDGTIWFGSTTAGADMAETEADTDITHVPWIEFSIDIAFQGSLVWTPRQRARTRSGVLIQM